MKSLLSKTLSGGARISNPVSGCNIKKSRLQTKNVCKGDMYGFLRPRKKSEVSLPGVVTSVFSVKKILESTWKKASTASARTCFKEKSWSSRCLSPQWAQKFSWDSCPHVMQVHIVS